MKQQSKEKDDPQSVALAFVAQINTGDPDRVADLMTEDHLFIDTAGDRVQGKEQMRTAWRAYYNLFPDYQVVITDTGVKDELVILRGYSSGTLSAYGRQVLQRADGSVPGEADFQGPAIWTASIRAGKVARWQVYLDNPQTRRTLKLA